MRISLFLFLLPCCLLSFAAWPQLSLTEAEKNEWRKNIYDRVPWTASYPYLAARNTPNPEEVWTYHYILGEGLFTFYRDLNLRQPSEEVFYGIDVCSVHRKFAQPNTSYPIAVIQVGLIDQFVTYLVSIDHSGAIKGVLEGEVAGPVSNGDLIFVKQWRIDQVGDHLEVTVYRLIPTASQPVLFGTTITTLRMRREDRVYRLDSESRFHLVSTIDYSPRDYTLEELSDIERNIWDGGEYLE